MLFLCVPLLQAMQDSKCLAVLQHQLPLLQHMMRCCQMQWLVLVVGSPGSGKSALVQQLAVLTGRKLRTISLTPQMDVGELLGGFEQVRAC